MNTRLTGIKGADNARRGLATLAAGALYLLSLSMILQLIAAWLDNPMQEVVLGALAVSLVAGRAGLGKESDAAPSWRLALRAAALTSLPLAMAMAFMLVQHGAMPEFVAPGVSLLFGGFEAFAVAYRDELWLHGIPLLFARRAGVPVSLAVLYAALVSVAAVALQPGASVAGLTMTLVAGGYFALLWSKTQSSWVPVSAHFAWACLSGSVLAGELVQLPQLLPYGAASSGLTAWVATLSFAVLAAFQYRGRPLWTSDNAGPKA
jgi:hypothetical protein